MAECDNMLQIQSRMAHFTTTTPTIHTTQSRIIGATSAIIFLKNMLIDNLITTRQTGQHFDVLNANLNNTIQRHKTLLHTLQSLPPTLTPTPTPPTPTSLPQLHPHPCAAVLQPPPALASCSVPKPSPPVVRFSTPSPALVSCPVTQPPPAPASSLVPIQHPQPYPPLCAADP